MIRPTGRLVVPDWFGVSTSIARFSDLGGRLGLRARTSLEREIDALRQGGDRCLGHRLVLLTAAAADTDGARDLAVHPDRDAACEDHHPAVVRCVDAEELVAGLAVAAKLQRRDIEGSLGEGLVDGDVD